jgi:anti-sigma B factor antagonist
MKFFATPLQRFRRPRTADGSSDQIAIVRLDHESITVATAEVVIRKHPQRTVVALGPSAICDVAKTQDLGSQLIGLLDADRPSLLVVDLQQVGQISSECLNQLINVNCYARSNGVKLILANLCQPLREVFRITRLDRLFEITDSE